MEALDPKPESSPARPGGVLRNEAIWLLLIVLVFVLINLLTADKSPAVWLDEAMYTDPAVNLYQGHGFTSSAWYSQSMDKFWAGNVPLYQFVLFGWLKVFGFSLTAVRSLHYVLTGLAAIITWCAVRRLGLICAPSHRLFFCVLFLLCSATTFNCRGARPDSLCLVFVASALLACSLNARSLRLFLLALLGILLVCTGLQMGPYMFLLSGLAWLLGPRSFRLESAVLCGGCVAGLGVLYLFYAQHGVWNDFVLSVRRHTIANEGVAYHNIAGYGVGFKDKFKSLPGLFRDYSFLPLAIVALWMGWRLWRARLLKKPSPFLFGVVAAVAVPVTLHFIGVFNLYYFWMAFIPLAVGVCAELQRQLIQRTAPFARLAILFLMLLACLLGLPRRLGVAAFEWRARSYEPVMKLAAPYVARDTFVFAESAAYYAAKQYGARVIVPTHYSVLRDEEKAKISVAIVRNSSAATLAHDFGGEWREVAALAPPPPRSPLPGLYEELGSQQYHLTVFVREH